MTSPTSPGASPHAPTLNPEPSQSWLMTRLERASTLAFVVFGGLTAFCVYFSMYAFRKPYAASKYEDATLLGWDIDFGFKETLVIAQILGYALSKVIGIKVISEMQPSRRAPAILGLIGISLLGLILFAVLPMDLKFLALFVNGLPLGLIWGLVFGFLEGRRTTEILGAMLSASFIVSSGIVKSVAVWLMNSGVSEFWMPAATGALFLPVLFISVYALSQLPPPTVDDIAARTQRLPMDGAQRKAFLGRYFPGLALLVGGYILLTVFRDFRDDFAVEIWADLGKEGDPTVLTQSEIPVAIITLIAFGCLVMIRNNRLAFLTIQGMSLLGAVLMGVTALGYVAGVVSPLWLMIGTGAGLYIGYMPFGAMLFERMIAATKTVANAGFLIYVADASGYLGTVSLLVYKNFFAADVPWLTVFLTGAFVTSAVCIVFFILAMGYFRKKVDDDETPAAVSAPAPDPRPAGIPVGAR
ncbi:MAG: DUF5690 family protein [Gordonia sp. (in: high G+C Gram-positive bacteria)]|uniref:DUF5690 family protein n=1 Tax=Gordonia sp. (in: high G+C Gram-positive bacteria) TaxID=84139 RepID=UPI0039E5A979